MSNVGWHLHPLASGSASGCWVKSFRLSEGIASIENKELLGLSFENDSLRLITPACLMFLTSDIWSSVCAKRFQAVWLTGSTEGFSGVSCTRSCISSDGSYSGDWSGSQYSSSKSGSPNHWNPSNPSAPTLAGSNGCSDVGSVHVWGWSIGCNGNASASLRDALDRMSSWQIASLWIPKLEHVSIWETWLFGSWPRYQSHPPETRAAHQPEISIQPIPARHQFHYLY